MPSLVGSEMCIRDRFYTFLYYTIGEDGQFAELNELNDLNQQIENFKVYLIQSDGINWINQYKSIQNKKLSIQSQFFSQPIIAYFIKYATNPTQNYTEQQIITFLLIRYNCFYNLNLSISQEMISSIMDLFNKPNISFEILQNFIIENLHIQKDQMEDPAVVNQLYSIKKACKKIISNYIKLNNLPDIAGSNRELTIDDLRKVIQFFFQKLLKKFKYIEKINDDLITEHLKKYFYLQNLSSLTCVDKFSDIKENQTCLLYTSPSPRDQA
eukprot:TRINITY_DN10816_c0_g1_i1.p1 TRINITY_DN10816_c0_g1~~TRINITY_DN10816_c0_g1_i1.p1  ORF type:complete len:269 (+),score=46.48 TRINITY_DN10816_c0_g1_i1:130-936(+)